MSIPEGKTRIMVTLPIENLEVFRQDARDFDMTLSQYMNLILCTMSHRMENDKGKMYADVYDRCLGLYADSRL